MGQPGQMSHMGQPGQMAHMGQMGHMGQMSHAASGPNAVPAHGYGLGPQGHAHSTTMRASAMAPPRSNAVVYGLIAVLMIAIGVLAYLVLTR